MNFSALVAGVFGLIVHATPSLAVSTPEHEPADPSTFYSDPLYTVQNQPVAMIASDLDGDGNDDLITLGYRGSSDGSISVHLNRGDGSLAQAHQIAACQRSVTFAGGDLNEDGRLDLVVGCAYAETLSIYFGDETEYFVFESEFQFEPVPSSIHVADVNQDLLADLVIASKQSSFVYVYPGEGDGVFGERIEIRIESEYQTQLSYALPADVNQDQIPDLIVTDNLAGLVFVLLGNGDGGFADPVEYPAGERSESVAVTDLDDDQLLDLVVSNAFGGLTVYRGNGDGTFVLLTDIGLNQASGPVCFVDLNLDGRLDILGYSGGTVFLRLEDGSFEYSGLASPLDNPTASAVIDLNGDPYPDIVVANYDSSTLGIFPGDGSGRYYEREYRDIAQWPEAFAVVDLNHDGLDDLVARHAVVDESENALSYELYSHLSNGDGSVQQRHLFQLNSNLRSLKVADLNGDGVFDLVLHDGGFSLSISMGSADGSFSDQVELDTTVHEHEFEIADFNRDGHLDIAAFRRIPSNKRALLFYAGIGDGRFEAPIEIAQGLAGSRLVARDINNDGIDDLLYTRGRRVLVYIGVGDGSFLASIESAYVWGDANFDTLADIDHDGHLDLVSFNDSPKLVITQFGDGSGAFPIKGFQSTSVPGYISQMEVGDYDNDGEFDVKYMSEYSYTYTILLGDGSGRFQQRQEFSSLIFASSVVMGMFDDKPGPDIAITSWRRNGFRFEFNQRPELFVSPADLNGDLSVDAADLGIMIREIGPCPRGESCLADLNADGVVDMADLGQLLADFGD